MFLDLLKTQLILKGVITPEEWKSISQELIFDFTQDSYYSEIKNSEMIRDRITLVGEMADQIGKYYSNTWVQRNILKLSDEEIKNMKDEITKEADDPLFGKKEDEGF